MKDGQWTWSFEEDSLWYNDAFDTKEEAITDGKECAKDEEKDCIYIGQIKLVGLPVIDAETILEQLGEQVYDEVGEVAEDYLINVPKEAVQELEEALNKVFEEWATKHKQYPSFYTLHNIERISV